MATIYYVREGSQPDNIVSNREIPVEDLIRLYGADPANYNYIKGADSPYHKVDQGPANPFSDPAHVVVKIEGDEVDLETFPEEGFYAVSDVRP